MLSGGVTANLSPSRILDAAESFRGSFVDLDQMLVVGPDELARARQRLSGQLAVCGLAAGDRVVMAIGNGPGFPVALAAIMARGGSPLLVHAKTPPSELRRTAMKFGAPFILAESWPAAELYEAVRFAQPIQCAEWLPAVWAGVNVADEHFQAPTVQLPGVPLHPTSGTTGVPKIAARPADCAMEEARHYAETIGIDRHDTLVAVAPMSHAYAYGMCVMVPLLTGASVVSMRTFSARLVLQALAEHPVTILPVVPAMLDALLFGASDRLRTGGRVVLAAGAPLAEKTAQRFQRRTGTVVRPLYGTTETGGIAVADGSGTPLPTGVVGRPMNGVEVEVGTRGHANMAGDEPMSVWVRSSSMMAGYLDGDGLDTSPLNDGWFRTGDLGRIQPSGAIHLLGRETDVINVAGMKVIPQEVEETIAALPGVREVKVYSGGDAPGSQFVKAAVVVDAQVTVDQIREYCEKQLVYYKRPTKILPVDALPRSPAGKIVRDQLP